MAVALLEKRRKAIRLRLEGLPYSDIRKRLRVSKSSLSYWLRGVELSASQRSDIAGSWVSRRVETYRETVRKRILALESQRLAEARTSLGCITSRDLRVAGLFLYLGEGTKVDRWSVCIANSDPEVIKFTVQWLTKVMGVSHDKIRVKVHLYKDMDVPKEVGYWSRTTGIPTQQFTKPYIKKSLLNSLDHKTHGHGTCNIIADNGPLKQKIMAEIRTVMESLTSGL